MAAALVMVVACGGRPAVHANLYPLKPGVPPHAGTINYLGMPLRSGQIVLSESPDTTSFVFSLVPHRFYYFTHAGILSIEDGEPYVYEASGELATLPLHSKVLDNVVGVVRRWPLLEYATPNLYVEIIDIPDNVDGEASVRYSRAQFANKTPFDPFFRFEDHSSLFCTEFLELALRSGGAVPREPGAVSLQASLAIGKQWLGVPMDQALPAGLYYEPSRSVGAMGQFRSRTAAFAYFEAKREIYRRFQAPNQRLGFVFELHGTGSVSLREPVRKFVTTAPSLFDRAHDLPAWGDARVTEAVRNYAEQLFGRADEAPPPTAFPVTTRHVHYAALGESRAASVTE